MRSETKRTKKLAKKRKLRKDFERRKNINRRMPSEVKSFQKTVYAPVLDENGKPTYAKSGEPIVKVIAKRVVSKRVKKERPKGEDGKPLPLVQYPKRRKFKLSKEGKVLARRAAIHAKMPTASGR